MIVPNLLKEKKDWKMKDLHKKIGQIFFIEPGDSDLQEGNFTKQMWFRTQTEVFLIREWDIRKDKGPC